MRLQGDEAADAGAEQAGNARPTASEQVAKRATAAVCPDKNEGVVAVTSSLARTSLSSEVIYSADQLRTVMRAQEAAGHGASSGPSSSWVVRVLCAQVPTGPLATVDARAKLASGLRLPETGLCLEPPLAVTCGIADVKHTGHACAGNATRATGDHIRWHRKPRRRAGRSGGYRHSHVLAIQAGAAEARRQV